MLIWCSVYFLDCSGGLHTIPADWRIHDFHERKLEHVDFHFIISVSVVLLMKLVC